MFIKRFLPVVLVVLLLSMFSHSGVILAQDNQNILQQGISAYWKGDYDASLTLLNEVLTDEPQNLTALAYRGTVYRVMQERDLAAADFETALALDPTFALAYSAQSRLTVDLGDYDKALEEAQKGVELAPDLVFSHYYLGRVYTFRKEYRQSIEVLTTAIDLDTGEDIYFSSVLMYSRGESLYFAQDYVSAIEDFNAALEIQPDYVDALAKRGDAQRVIGNYQQAIADFDRVLIMKPDRAYTLAARGDIYRMMGREDLALSDLDHALEVDPDLQYGLAARAAVYNNLKRFDEALVDANRALELKPDDIFALEIRGDSHRRLGHYELARDDFSRVLAVTPNNVEALRYRADCYRMLGEYDLALADATRAIEISPYDDYALGTRGAVYEHEGEYEAALADLTRAIELNPRDDFYYATRGAVYIGLGRSDEALVDLDKALEINPNSIAVTYRSMLLSSNATPVPVCTLIIFCR